MHMRRMRFLGFLQNQGITFGVNICIYITYIQEYFKQHGEPLFSSHMLDLSEEPLEENIAICKKYLERMAKV